MGQDRPTRDEAWHLLCEHNGTDKARRHALAVEAVMRHMARREGADEDEWGLVGLVHDLDYERHPDQHCHKAKEILAEAGWPEAWVRAVISHGWGICTDVQPESRLEKTLYAIDELTGLVSATALVRPSRSLADLTPKSVRKKWKDRRFAAGVDRSIIERGAEMLGVELDALVAEVIEGMRCVATDIGLAGAP